MTAARHEQLMGSYDESSAMLQLLSSTACMGGAAGMIKQKSLLRLFLCLLIQTCCHLCLPTCLLMHPSIHQILGTHTYTLEQMAMKRTA